MGLLGAKKEIPVYWRSAGAARNKKVIPQMMFHDLKIGEEVLLTL